MHYLALLVAAATLTSHIIAAPTKVQGFTVHQVAGKKFLKNGPSEVKKTFEKFGKAVPADVAIAATVAAVAAAAAATQTGSVIATPANAYDISYLCPVTLGTPGVTLNLDFDTGSSDFWVFSSEMPSSERTGHAYYTLNASTTGENAAGETWSIVYGDGSGASGKVYADYVVIGGVTATYQAIEAATSVSSAFTTGSGDGLVGLGFQDINECSPKQCTTFMGTVGSSLNSNLFTASLKYHAPGSYDFGFINASKYAYPLDYTPVTPSNGYWEFSAKGYSVGSGRATAYSMPNTIADTGTTLIYLPNQVVSAYYAQVSNSTYAAAGGYVFPCSATLPDFNIDISGNWYTVPGAHMNYGPISGSTCFGALQSSSGIGINILGDVFLKSVFVVFDVGNSRIGFAPQSTQN